MKAAEETNRATLNHHDSPSLKKCKSADRGIESLNGERSRSAIEELPLPEGDGRGENSPDDSRIEPLNRECGDSSSPSPLRSGGEGWGEEALRVHGEGEARTTTNRRSSLVVEPVEVDSEHATVKNGNSSAPKKNNRRRNMIAGITALVVAAALGTYYLVYVAPYESTDDAFIEAHVTPIAPQVSGRVEKVLVRDNQFVNAGDVLVQIDPSDYEAKLDQERANLSSAKSRLAQANSQFTVDQAKVEEEKANVVAAEAESKRAAADSIRYQEVGTSGVSQSQLDLADTQARSAAANVTAARSKELAAEAQATLDQANIQTAASQVKENEAAVRQAELDLSYTQVKAHEAGYVTHRTVESDSYVQPGQALLAIVPNNVWVVANFKETQLAHMRAGQPVTLRIDAYPQTKFTGHVDSIQAGAGARFSLLPPENASGNYVKVVQRVPVKIALDNENDAQHVLGPGMSVVPEVRVK